MNEIDIAERFRSIFGGAPRVFRAPGRVNLIGEHTDYNQGFVLPIAINRATFVAGRVRDDTLVNVHALDVNGSATIDLAGPAVKRRGGWLDYVQGTARCLQARGFGLRGADLIFSSSVPLGAGLSSSAALEVSIGYALLALSELEIDPPQLAFAAQEAEHEFVGLRSGIMDQFASVFSRADHALLLDCRSLETDFVPLDLNGKLIAVCDTRVKHELASSEYNVRRAECEEGVRLLRAQLPAITSLRDVSIEEFQQGQADLPDRIMLRCRHIITENARTLAAAEALRQNDFTEFGRLMRLSHVSMRDDYEISCPELDLMVAIADRVDGVYGARLTGGGFGGCTVNILVESAWPEFEAAVTAQYSAAFQVEPKIYRVRASEGAAEL
ncbi:MAG: galactokinase [Pyrinomonadaceae bacterium]